MFLIFLFIYLLAIVSAFFNFGAKIVTFIGFLTLAYFAGTMDPMHSFDTAVYMQMYGMPPMTKIFESGYMYVSYVAGMNGISYVTFRIAVYYLAYLLFFVFIVRFSKRPNIFFLIYAIVPFVDDATQVRNFVMYSLVLTGLTFLVEKKLWRIVVSCVLIFLSTKFQTTGYIYFLCILMILIPMEKLKKLADVVVKFIIVASILIVISNQSTFIANQVGRLAALSDRTGISDALSTYASGGSSRYTLAVIFSYIILYLIISIINKRDKFIDESEKAQILYSLFTVAAVAIPFTYLSDSFSRILRNAMIIGIIIFVDFIVRHKNDLKKEYLLMIIMFISSMALLMYGDGYFNSAYGFMGQFIPYIFQLK